MIENKLGIADSAELALSERALTQAITMRAIMYIRRKI